MTKYPFHISNESITIFNGAAKTVRNGHANFFRIRAALLDGQYELALQLMDMPSFIQNASNGDFIVKNGVVNYGGLILNDIISQKLVSIILDGGVNCDPVKRYVERIIKNPSRNSANELYDFLGYRELPITPDGTVLAWKGVSSDLWSKHGNKTTKVLQGKVNEEGQIFNEIGATIEVERICVDDNRGNECSYGLHVGSYDYAKGWGERLLLVEFDPADAVSVPKDHEFQKLRVCKYKVLADMTGKDEISKPVVDRDDIDEDGIDLDDIQSPSEYIESMTIMNMDVWDQSDALTIRDHMCRDLRMNKMQAWDEILCYRIKVLRERVFDYIDVNGSKTLKQIQSCLKIKGVTCEVISSMIKDDDEVFAITDNEPLSEQVVSLK